MGNAHDRESGTVGIAGQQDNVSTAGVFTLDCG